MDAATRRRKRRDGCLRFLVTRSLRLADNYACFRDAEEPAPQYDVIV
jgi:hypothetical protein